MFRRLLTALYLAALVLSLSVKPVHASEFVVTSTSDSGDGSLRWAINQANANPEPDTITFDIPNALCPTGICYIYPLTALPTLTDDGTTIDGYTQPGAAPATSSTPATIVIQIDGGHAINNNGLNIISADNLIQGLSITRFNGNGIFIATGGSNVIAGNYIGVHANGMSDGGNGLDGVFVGYSAKNNFVGGDTPNERNVISGNGLEGVAIHASGTDGNTVSGNYIGTDDSGTLAMPNDLHGVRIYGGAQDNTIGGDTPGERNVISGNTQDGVRIVGATTTGNTVSGNYIGMDADGSSDLGNGQRGVGIDDAGENTIGPGNLISGNDSAGVRVINPNATGNVIRDNNIGTDAGGSLARANGGEGIYLIDAPDNTIGPGNVISGNDGVGIWIDDADGTTVLGNFVGVGASGMTPLGNQASGVFISGESQNVLTGGISPTERNVISANDGYGIHVADVGTAHITITGNYVGLGANGSTALGNADGIRIDSGIQDITIGGETPGERNVISGNGGYGIWLTGTDTTGNVILGNYIGTDASGSNDRGNLYSGVALWSGAHGNTVGGDVPGARNIISGNGEDGIELTGAGTADNTISGNYIGTDAGGSVAIGNDHAGVRIANGAQDNIVGGITAGDRNIISGNQYGVVIADEGTSGNFISGNYIGTAVDRLDSLGNQRDGVHIAFGAQSNAIGPGNTIAHNFDDGVRIDTPLAFGNLVLENSIFDNFNMGIDLTNGANHEIQPPIITASTVVPLSVSGSACANCVVEVFCSQDTDGEGEIWLGQLLADSSGEFTLALDWLSYPYLTATASLPEDGTSEFSEVFTAQMPNVIYLPTIMQQY